MCFSKEKTKNLKGEPEFTFKPKIDEKSKRMAQRNSSSDYVKKERKFTGSRQYTLHMSSIAEDKRSFYS